jgi:hypothetical protein
MSGRGHYGNKGGGRGPGNRFFNSNSTNKNKPDTKKVIQDFTYHKTGNAKQASEYEATTEFIIHHVKQSYDYGDDIATSMKDLTLLSTDSWKPSLIKSTQADQASKKAEDKQFKLQFQEDNKNTTEANAILFDKKFDPTYKDTKDQNNHNQNTESKVSGDEVNLSFDQIEGKCYCCGQEGHKSPVCRYKDKPKDQWVINKALLNQFSLQKLVAQNLNL